MIQPKNYGYVFEKKNKWCWQIKVNGKRLTKTLNANSRNEAEKEAISRFAVIAQVKDDMEVAMFVARAKNILNEHNLAQKERLTFSQAINKYLNSAIRNQCTQSWDQEKISVWEKFSDFMNCSYLDEITDEKINVWFNKLKKSNISNKTINVKVGIIKTIFRNLRIENEFLFKIPKLPVLSREILAFTPEQIQRIFDSVDFLIELSIPHRHECSVLFRILAYTGMRLKDACLLRWVDWDKNRNMLNVTPCKTRHSSKKQIWIPVHPKLREQLEKTATWKVDDFFLPAVAKSYLHDKTAVDKTCRMIINWAVWDKPIADRRPPNDSRYVVFSFRHSFVTFCATNGVPMEFVSEIIGVNSIMVARYYLNLQPQVYEHVINSLPSI